MTEVSCLLTSLVSVFVSKACVVDVLEGLLTDMLEPSAKNLK